MQVAPFHRLLFVLGWLILAGGCGQISERPTPLPATDPDVARAAGLIASEQFLPAATLYRQLAARAPMVGERIDFLLAAAEASRSGNDWDATREILAQLGTLPRDAGQSLRHRLLTAQVLLQERAAAAALDALGDAPGPETASALRIRYHLTQASTYRQMGNLLETAHALQAVDALQSDPAERLQTQTEILRTLALLNERVLRELQPSPPGIAGGWMQLAMLLKQHGSDPDTLAPLMAQWRQQFPTHPALPELLQNYQLQLQSQLQRAAHIAVLLPQSGTFAPVAAAIRDGMLVSRFQLAPDKRPELRFYDATDPAAIWPLFSRAVADGAELVIGPLQKEAVAQLLRAGELPVPVLALNQVELDAIPPNQLFMYSLSPEDEARQAAERTWVDGSRRPVVLVPQGDWGERLAEAFTERWRGLGGEIAAIGRYDATAHDFSETITRALHIDHSIARHRRLQGWLGRRLEFDPQRRDDVDAVFLAARPVQAQGMHPQLQFHRAGDLPVYATSHAWYGELTASQLADMKGIMLADIPWLVADDASEDSRSMISRHLPNSGSAYARLYAMGMDALRLAPHLKRLQSSRYESLDGSTGNLYMDEQQQLHRQLVWVRLGDPPTILGYSPRLDLQGAASLAIPDPSAAAIPDPPAS